MAAVADIMSGEDGPVMKELSSGDGHRNRGLSGREGLGVYVRYLSATVPDFSLARSSDHESGERPPRTGEASSENMEKTGPAFLPTREMLLAELAEKARGCSSCVLARTRKNVVFGEGNPEATLMFVGEGPGADEDATGRPFVGKAGELLTKMILAMGLSRPEVYIANVVKCRPPGNRPPDEAERMACFSFLRGQIEIVSPRFMILLGQTAATGLLHAPAGISKLRGKETRLPGFPGIRTIPTYHPAYLLRNPSAKVLVWEDLQKVMGWMKEEGS